MRRIVALGRLIEGLRRTTKLGVKLASDAKRRLFWALGLTATFMVVEAVVGFLSGSLALIADAGHMFGDASALVLALIAQIIAGQPRTQRRTYGARRAEVLAAFTNGLLLVGVAGWIFFKAIQRWQVPEPIAGTPMLITAIIGLLINLVVLTILHRDGHDHGHHGHAHEPNPNVRAARMHVLSDALGSIGAIVAAAIILVTGFERADTLVSLVVATLVVISAFRIMRDTTHVLMESTPTDLCIEELEGAILDVRGVSDLHDLHAWTISTGFDIVTVHVVLEPGYHGVDVAERVAALVRTRFGVDHVTVQPEAPVAQLVPLRIPEVRAANASGS